MKLRNVLRNTLVQVGLRVPTFLLEDEVRAMRRMARLHSKEDVVLDLGAHVGKAATEFSYYVQHVYAFEPNPLNFTELKHRTRSYSNIDIFEQAISKETGTGRLYFEDAKPGRFYEGATIVSGKSNVSYKKHFDVETKSISDLLDQIDSDRIVIKMDIEGAEYMVLDALLDSSRLNKVKKVYVECHVDRIPELAEPKRRVLDKAQSLGVSDKLDFTWP